MSPKPSPRPSPLNHALAEQKEAKAWRKAAALEADRLAAALTYVGVKVERPDAVTVVVRAPENQSPFTMCLSATTADLLTRAGKESNVSIPRSRRAAFLMAMDWVEPSPPEAP